MNCKITNDIYINDNDMIGDYTVGSLPSSKSKLNGCCKIIIASSILLAAPFEYTAANVYNDDYQKINKAVSDIVNEPVNRLSEELQSFTILPDNWDGYEAIAVLEKCANNATLLISKIPEEYITKIDSFYPNPNGTITFEWENNLNKTLSLEVGKDTMSYYVETEFDDPIFVAKRSFDRVSIEELVFNIYSFLYNE